MLVCTLLGRVILAMYHPKSLTELGEIFYPTILIALCIKTKEAKLLLLIIK
jgi:hypothetical protein